MMASQRHDRKGNRWVKTLGLGALVGALYAVLFWNETDLLALTAQGGWTFVLPLLIAFLFSLVHGAFTHHFWELWGIRGRAAAEPATGGQ
jgi:uncharacterized integral membrane protein